MPHIGQPAFGANEAIVDVDQVHSWQSVAVSLIQENHTHHVTLMATLTTVAAHFDLFRKEIDDHNDTRERLIKVLFFLSPSYL